MAKYSPRKLLGRGDADPKIKRRGRKRMPPIEERAYYTREEVCTRYGLSAKRLAEAIANDEALPMVRNGRNQLFPKAAMQAWYEAAAAARQNVHTVGGPDQLAEVR
jgi:hypothetical protein